MNTINKSSITVVVIAIVTLAGLIGLVIVCGWEKTYNQKNDSLLVKVDADKYQNIDPQLKVKVASFISNHEGFPIIDTVALLDYVNEALVTRRNYLTFLEVEYLEDIRVNLKEYDLLSTKRASSFITCSDGYAWAETSHSGIAVHGVIHVNGSYIECDGDNYSLDGVVLTDDELLMASLDEIEQRSKVSSNGTMNREKSVVDTALKLEQVKVFIEEHGDQLTDRVFCDLLKYKKTLEAPEKLENLSLEGVCNEN